MNTLANAQKNSRALYFHRRIAVIWACLLLGMVGSSTWADSRYQVDWQPNKYKVVCQDSGGCRLNQATYRKIEAMMTEVVSGLKAMGFRAPLGFGNRVGEGTPDDSIELYDAADHIDEHGKEEKADGIAGAVCRSPDGEITSTIQFGSQLGEFVDRAYLVHFILAHEYAHIIQHYYPFRSSTSCKPSVPGWIAEGLATALGLESMRKKYFPVEPTGKNDREARLFSGLRRYDITLADRRIIESRHGFTEAWTGGHYQYRTSSFWRHLANVYYEGKYNFVGRYMDLEAVNGDWLGWLWNNIKLDTDENLSMVHAGFLADFAGWSKKGFPGQFYNRIQWLKKSFGGCQTIYLNKTEASDYVDVDIEPLGGKCIIVRVGVLGESGIADDESATVQVAATVMSGPTDARDGLHLGFAKSNDKQAFHCAAEVKRDRKKGLGRCLRIPDDGKIRINGGEIDARVWNVFPQEKGKEGEIVNLYTVSYTPALLTSFQNLYVTGPITARFYFVLDVANLEIDESKMASKGSKKKGAVAHFAEGGDPQTTVPKQNERGMPANSYSLPESLRPSIAVAPLGSIGAATGKLGQIVVSQGQAAGIVLVPGKLNAGAGGKFEPHPLSVGDTGEFPVGLLSGSINGEPLVGLGPGLMTVDEFSDLVFRASYSGTLCRLMELKPGKPCPKPVQVSGQVVKAFAGTRLPGRHMKVVRTPGTEIYRKANEKGMGAWSTATHAPATPGGDSPTPGTPTGGGGAIEDCACTCEEFEATNRAAEEMKQREAAGENVEVGTMMGLMSCHSTCQREYMICAMEQGDREKAARKEKQKADRTEAARNCDCSCAALQNLEAKTAEILGQMQSGNQSAMQEMQKLGQCMSVCQSALMRCARSR